MGSEDIDCYDYSFLEESHPVKMAWNDIETKALLEKYYSNISEIGPFKTFRNKKEMWAMIGDETTKQFESYFNPTQCESRYKTEMKRKKIDIDNNKKSGSSRATVPFEEELSLINSKEEAKDRRHREKMELIRELYAKSI